MLKQSVQFLCGVFPIAGSLHVFWGLRWLDLWGKLCASKHSRRLVVLMPQSTLSCFLRSQSLAERGKLRTVMSINTTQGSPRNSKLSSRVSAPQAHIRRTAKPNYKYSPPISAWIIQRTDLRSARKGSRQSQSHVTSSEQPNCNRQVHRQVSPYALARHSLEIAARERPLRAKCNAGCRKPDEGGRR